jgi:hypothetical protein
MSELGVLHGKREVGGKARRDRNLRETGQRNPTDTEDIGNKDRLELEVATTDITRMDRCRRR